jgi:hypothetical protein
MINKVPTLCFLPGTPCTQATFAQQAKYLKNIRLETTRDDFENG